MRKSNKRIILKTAIVFFLLLLVLEFILFIVSSFDREQEINDLNQKSNHIHAELDKVFQSSITISDGYLSYITSNTDATKEETETFLNHLFSYDENYIRNIAVIEDTTIIYNYPFDENQESIGTDLSTVERQSVDVLRVKNELSTLFAGPVELVQGGTAFILRLPIIENDIYWGQLAVVIDAGLLKKSIEDEANDDDIYVEITNELGKLILAVGETENEDSVSSIYSNKYFYWSVDVTSTENSGQVVTPGLQRVLGLSVILLVCYLLYRSEMYNKEIEYKSKHDSLSNDYNREKFTSDFKSGRFINKLIVFADVNKFKLINDTLGHSFGDWVLIQLSNRFNSYKQFRTYRISGDEFILVSNESMTVRTFKQTIPSNRFLFYNEELKQEIDIDISVGILENLTSETELESVLMYLDYAMYDAKKEGKGSTVVTKELMTSYDTTKIMEQKIIEDIKKNKLLLYYQPIINLKSKQIDGFEVLSRWNYQGKIHSAGTFIDTVKKIKYVDLVDKNLIRKLQDEYTSLVDDCSFISNLSFSVNLSAETLMIIEKKNSMFDKLLSNQQIPNSKLIFEISEDMNLGLISIDTLRYIQNKGFSISVDDFGAGVSKLSDVLSGELNTIKTDKSLLPISSNEHKVKGFNTIIKAIQSSGSKICVEGVETKQQLELSRQNGCTYAQGYLLGKPMPKDMIVDYINSFDYRNFEYDTEE